MIRFILLALVLFLGNFFCVLPVYADASRVLTAEETKRFVDSLSPSYAFAQQMEKEGKTSDLNVVKENLTGGDINIYTQHIVKFKEKYPKDYDAFTVLVKQFHFSACEEWASVGDAVIMAYLAGQDNFDAILEDMEKNITPEILEKMPKEARENTKAALTMMRAIKNIPHQNIVTVKPHAAKIKSVMDELR